MRNKAVGFDWCTRGWQEGNTNQYFQCQYFPKHKYGSVINRVRIWSPSNSQFNVWSLWNVHRMHKVWDMLFWNEDHLIVSWLWSFQHLRIFNGRLPADKFALASRNPEIGIKTSYSKHWKIVKLWNSSWAGVFKTQVKCCRNKLKYNPLTLTAATLYDKMLLLKHVFCLNLESHTLLPHEIFRFNNEAENLWGWC